MKGIVKGALTGVVIAVMGFGPAVEEASGQKLGREEFEARVAVFEFLFENYVSRHPKGEASDFCIVTGRRSHVALEHQERTDEDWDEVGPFLRRFVGKGVGVHPISECTWDGDEAEMVRVSQAPAVSVAMAPVSWKTPTSGTVHMRIQENWRHTYGLRCMIDGADGSWRVFNCVDRAPNPSFIGSEE